MNLTRLKHIILKTLFVYEGKGPDIQTNLIILIWKIVLSQSDVIQSEDKS